MPKVSGVELLKKIYAARMSLSVIMATGFLPTWEFTLHPCLQPVQMLLKPYSFGKLLGMVKNVLSKHASVPVVTAVLGNSPTKYKFAEKI
jgi:DNA-binding NtrC family response regulator